MRDQAQGAYLLAYCGAIKVGCAHDEAVRRAELARSLRLEIEEARKREAAKIRDGVEKVDFKRLFSGWGD